ncbi:hypothetical protein ACFV4I_21965 [Nocardiopsis alba]|uniref:hypothetical protein n=1 Tax=Nocardiopsis alba TaxID=53437 RepID=UPI0030B8063C
MTPRTIPPLIRVLAPAITLALLLSACGGSDTGGPSPAEDGQEASAEGGSEETTDQPSITESGLISRSYCENSRDDVITVYSADDGTEISSLTFSGDLVAADTSEALGHGRAPDIEQMINYQDFDVCGGQLISVSPHEHLLLRSYEEEVNGSKVQTFGVISEEGAVTTLAPEQEVSDFGTPVDYLNPLYDAVNERIVFVEYDTSSSEGTVQAMDLHSAEISDLGTCEGINSCDELAVLPQSGIVVGGDLAYPFSPDAQSGATDRIVVESPSGETLIHADYTETSYSYTKNETTLYFIDIETALSENPDIIGMSSSVAAVSQYRVKLDIIGEPEFIDENTLLLKSNELAVWEFTEELLAEHGPDEESGDFTSSALPVEDTLIPEGPRRNENVLLSPDRTEILFYSSPESGPGSWYRVPSDGSSEPEEAPELANLDAFGYDWR